MGCINEESSFDSRRKKLFFRELIWSPLNLLQNGNRELFSRENSWKM
jgi:hypothetical protein